MLVNPIIAKKLLELSGPTKLDVGDVLTNEVMRRVAGTLVGRQFDMLRLSSSSISTITASADVSADLTTPLKAATNYMVLWMIQYATAATTTGLRVALNYSGGTLNSILYGIFGATAAAAMQSAVTGTNDGLLGAAGVGPGSTTVVELLYGIVRTTTAGTLAARFASGVAASSVTIGPNTHMLVIQQ